MPQISTRMRSALTIALFCVVLPLSAAEPAPGKDALGDPLPPFALGRLGTTRLRQRWTVIKLAYSSDGKFLVGSSYEEGVCVYDAASGRRLRKLPIEPENGHFDSKLALSRDSKVLVTTAGRGKYAQTWEMATGKERGARLKLDSGEILALSADAKHLATGRAGNPKVTIWNLETSQSQFVLPRAGIDFSEWSAAACFSPDGKTLLVGGAKRMRFWDVATGKEIRRLEGEARRLGLSTDGRLLAALGERELRVWDLTTGEVRRTIDGIDIPRINDMAFAADGRTVALAGEFTVQAWVVATGERILARTDDRWYETVAIAPDGRTIAWGMMYHPTIHRWDIKTRREIPTGSSHEEAVRGLSFAPDGKTLVTTGMDRRLRFWSLDRGWVRRETDRAASPAEW